MIFQTSVLVLFDSTCYEKFWKFSRKGIVPESTVCNFIIPVNLKKFFRIAYLQNKGAYLRKRKTSMIFFFLSKTSSAFGHQLFLLTTTTEMYRSNPLGVFSEKDVLKICSKSTAEHPCQNVVSMQLY